MPDICSIRATIPRPCRCLAPSIRVTLLSQAQAAPRVRMEDLDPNSVEYLNMKQQDLSNKFKDENARRNFLQLERVGVPSGGGVNSGGAG